MSYLAREVCDYSAVQLRAFCERPGGAGGGSGVVHMWQRGRGQRALGTSSFNSDSPASHLKSKSFLLRYKSKHLKVSPSLRFGKVFSFNSQIVLAKIFLSERFLAFKLSSK